MWDYRTLSHSHTTGNEQGAQQLNVFLRRSQKQKGFVPWERGNLRVANSYKKKKLTKIDINFRQLTPL